MLSRHGLPGKLLTDRGSTLISEAFQGFLRHLLSSPYHPQTNGAIEKLNGTLKTKIKSVSDDFEGQWDLALPWLLFAYRSVGHSSTGFSPFFLLYGRKAKGPLGALYGHWVEPGDGTELPLGEYVHQLCSRVTEALAQAQKNLEEQAGSRKRYYDLKKKVKVIDYKVGDPVLVHLPVAGKPLMGALQGPYVVQEKVGSHTFIVHLSDKCIKRRIFHVNVLRPWNAWGEQGSILAYSHWSSESVGDVVAEIQSGKPTDMEINYGA